MSTKMVILTAECYESELSWQFVMKDSVHFAGFNFHDDLSCKLEFGLQKGGSYNFRCILATKFELEFVILNGIWSLHIYFSFREPKEESNI